MDGSMQLQLNRKDFSGGKEKATHHPKWKLDESTQRLKESTHGEEREKSNSRFRVDSSGIKNDFSKQIEHWWSESGSNSGSGASQVVAERVERQRRRSGTRQHRRQGISPFAAVRRYPKSRTRPLATAREARTPCVRTPMACGTVRDAGTPPRLRLPSSSPPMAAAYSATPSLWLDIVPIIVFF
jgi:hypothetical protein